MSKVKVNITIKPAKHEGAPVTAHIMQEKRHAVSLTLVEFRPNRTSVLSLAEQAVLVVQDAAKGAKPARLHV